MQSKTNTAQSMASLLVPSVQIWCLLHVLQQDEYQERLLLITKESASWAVPDVPKAVKRCLLLPGSAFCSW